MGQKANAFRAWVFRGEKQRTQRTLARLSERNEVFASHFAGLNTFHVAAILEDLAPISFAGVLDKPGKKKFSVEIRRFLAPVFSVKLTQPDVPA
jgi:hypothetical protein